jgi:hypothetical protein
MLQERMFSPYLVEAQGLTQKFIRLKEQCDRCIVIQTAETIDGEFHPSQSLLASRSDWSTLNQDSAFLHELKPKDVKDKRLPDPCMEGTRKDVFAEIDAWVDDLDTPNILWLKGFPGTGKSAIAMSTMNRLTRSSRLGSAFFFERDNANQKTAPALWRSVASDLAHRYPSLRSVIARSRSRSHQSRCTTIIRAPY